VPDGGTGIWVSAAYAVTLRVIGVRKVAIHYRNFSFFRRHHPAMQCLVNVLGSRAHHIFLDGAMRELFAQIYGQPRYSLVVSNAATCDVAPLTAALPGPEDPVRIGYLSNLTFEKGFGIVVAAFTRLADMDPELLFAIAGTPVGEPEKRLLYGLQAILGTRLSYHGQVHGASKQAFFESLDIFLFPTTYKQEAQPNVIFEALAVGNTVISTRHAAIPGMFGAAPHVLIDVNSRDLTSEIVAATRAELDVLGNPANRTARRNAVRSAFILQQSEARVHYSSLLQLLIGP